MHGYLNRNARRGLVGAGALALTLGMPLSFADTGEKTPKATVSPSDEENVARDEPAKIGGPGAEPLYEGMDREQLGRMERNMAGQREDLARLRESLKAADRGIGDPGAGQVDRETYHQAMERAREVVDSMENALEERQRQLDRQQMRFEEKGMEPQEDTGDTG